MIDTDEIDFEVAEDVVQCVRSVASDGPTGRIRLVDVVNQLGWDDDQARSRARFQLLYLALEGDVVIRHFLLHARCDTPIIPDLDAFKTEIEASRCAELPWTRFRCPGCDHPITAKSHLKVRKTFWWADD